VILLGVNSGENLISYSFSNLHVYVMTSVAEDIKKVVDMGESLPPNKIVGGIKRAIVKQGRENEFESLFRELAAKVREHDKGCNYYDLYR
jgi:hypothetical protein